MSFLCSCFTKRRPEQHQALFQEQFEIIRRVYPNTIYVCVLNSTTGAIIAQSDIRLSEAHTEEMSRTIISVQRAALQFASTLEQANSQVIHIKGDASMFSCFGVDDMILAFYTRMSGLDLELMNFTDADKAIETIAIEIARLADEMQGPRQLNQRNSIETYHQN